jgi:hypothetical protein
MCVFFLLHSAKRLVPGCLKQTRWLRRSASNLRIEQTAYRATGQSTARRWNWNSVQLCVLEPNGYSNFRQQSRWRSWFNAYICCKCIVHSSQ